MAIACVSTADGKLHNVNWKQIYIYKWHVCPGSYNKNPEEEQEEEVEEKK